MKPTCDRCQQEFRGESGLRWHLEYRHGQEADDPDESQVVAAPDPEIGVSLGDGIELLEASLREGSDYERQVTEVHDRLSMIEANAHAWDTRIERVEELCATSMATLDDALAHLRQLDSQGRAATQSAQQTAAAASQVGDRLEELRDAVSAIWVHTMPNVARMTPPDCLAQQVEATRPKGLLIKTGNRVLEVLP